MPMGPNSPPATRTEIITPKAGQPRGLTQNLRRENIAIQLLQNQDKNNEFEALDRIDQENQDRAGNRAQEWPEKRNQIRHTQQHSQQRRIRHVNDTQSHEANQTDQNRYHDITPDKAAKHLIRIPYRIHNALHIVRSENGADDLLAWAASVSFIPII